LRNTSRVVPSVTSVVESTSLKSSERLRVFPSVRVIPAISFAGGSVTPSTSSIGIQLRIAFAHRRCP
jgi:hypothetical protein